MTLEGIMLIQLLGFLFGAALHWSANWARDQEPTLFSYVKMFFVWPFYILFALFLVIQSCHKPPH
jgi:hypothetical protein